MPTTSQYITALDTCRDNLATNLVTKGVEASSSEKFNTLVDKVLEIPAGGGEEPEYIYFYDYDGTLVTSWNVSDLLSKTELPANPDRTSEGLTADGWNWTLEQLKAENGPMIVGQMYHPTDNKLHLFISVTDDRKLISIVALLANGTFSYDWGDGSAIDEYQRGPGFQTITQRHTYSVPGIYEIIIGTSEGGEMKITGYDYSYLFTTPSGVTSNANHVRTYLSALRKSYIPSWVILGNAAFRECNNLELVILSSGMTYESQNISNLFIGCIALRYVVFPTSLQTTLLSCFFNCHSLNGVSLPYGISQLGTGFLTFANSIKQITLPSSITTIPSNVFNNCYALEKIYINGSISSLGSSALSNCNALKRIAIKGTYTSIPSSLFNNDRSLETFIISDSVTSIGDGAFENCSSISSITLPDSVTSIGTLAFSGCMSLRSINIPDNITTISSSAFNNCYALNLDSSALQYITSIQLRAFVGCYSISLLNLPSITSLGQNAFSQSGLQKIVLPNTLSLIPNHLFSDCRSLTLFNISNLVTSIGEGVFSNSSIIELTIPSNITIIPDYLCYGSILRTVNIEGDVTSIGSYAFSKCVWLTAITLPASVTSIKSYAFNGCYGLAAIKFMSTTPPTVSSSNVFSGLDSQICTIYVPTGSLSAYTSATNYPNSSTYTYVEYDPE